MLELTSTAVAALDQVAETVLDRHLEQNTARPLALALSGGGDSIALLMIAARWAAARGRPLVALTVDHGLNPQSLAWTRSAALAAQQQGVAWRSLTWTGVKPYAGVQAAARGARHRLLANAARSLGASVVLFGHTLDDVFEGDWMRQKDAPSLGRLRPWSPSPVWPEGREIFILRPLLSLRRAQLRAWLLDRGAKWVEDPANDDPRFARARARAALTTDPPAPRLPAPAPSAPQAAALRFEADAEGSFRFGRIDWPKDLALARRLLSAAVACASGSPSPPPSAGLTRLVALCQTQETFVATLAGARILAECSCLTISREAGEFIRRPAKAAFLPAGATTVWDGRFEIKAARDLELTPLSGRAARLSRSDRACLAVVAPERRPSLPALAIDGAVCLPQPWGDGPAAASQLCGRRFIAACGLLAHEREISQDHMAEGRQSSYVEVQALA